MNFSEKLSNRLCVGFKSTLYLDIILHPRNQYVELAFGKDVWDPEIVDTCTQRGIKSHHFIHKSVLWKISICLPQLPAVAIFNLRCWNLSRKIPNCGNGRIMTSSNIYIEIECLRCVSIIFIFQFSVYKVHLRIQLHIHLM